MHNILITGAGKIGSAIACVLSQSKDYQVTLADISFSSVDVRRLVEVIPEINTVQLDVQDRAGMEEYLDKNNHTAIISSLPYFRNDEVVKVARDKGLHYFDLTEDTQVTALVAKLAEGAQTAFVPQCGLAPGFISIVANQLMQNFDELDTVKLRVGALPQTVNNALQYALTWSTDGLINEYGNPCLGIKNGKEVTLHPLESLENLQLDGQIYECFNTSGGLGSLATSYAGKVRELNYKTIRYPGHCEKMRVLMNDLRLNEDRDTLKRILENAVPKTNLDVIIVYVSVTGKRKGELIEEHYVKKVYPQMMAGLQWSGIQITTAAGMCGVVDIVLNNPEKYRGIQRQENFSLDAFLANQFGTYYR